MYVWTVGSCSYATLTLVAILGNRNFFVGALAYADDITLLVPYASAMRTLFNNSR